MFVILFYFIRENILEYFSERKKMEEYWTRIIDFFFISRDQMIYLLDIDNYIDNIDNYFNYCGIRFQYENHNATNNHVPNQL